MELPTRAALLLSGSVMPRHGSKLVFQNRICVDLDSCKQHVIEQIPCDIFCFFWDVPTEYRKELDEYLCQLNPVRFVLQETIPFDNHILLRDGTKAKYDQSKMMRKVDNFRYEFAVQSMFYSIKMVNDIKKQYEQEKGISYDWVIRTRPDITYGSKLNIQNLKDNTKLYLPETQHNSLCNDWGGYNDQFAISGPGVIDLYASTYDNLEKILYENGKREFLSSEKILKIWIDSNKVQVDRVKIRYNITGRAGDKPFYEHHNIRK